MKFSDSARLALHNLRNNLSRSVLTVVIVSVVSALIMSLMLLGISFSQNKNDFGKLAIRHDGAQYSLYNVTDAVGHRWGPISDEEYEYLRTRAKNYKGAVTEAKLTLTAGQTFSMHAAYGKTAAEMPEKPQEWESVSSGVAAFPLKELEYASVPENFLLAGRMWREEDESEPLVWLSKVLTDRLAAQGIPIGVGDPVTFFLYTRSTAGGTVAPAEYTVAGIYDPAVLDGPLADFYQMELFMGFDGFFAQIEDPDRSFRREVDFLCLPADDDYSYPRLVRNMENYLDDVNQILGRVAIRENGKILKFGRFRNSHIDAFRYVEIINLVAVGISVVLSAIVLLLCVGSVANAIVISVDKNKKFLGLLKALGLDARGVRKIVLLETFLLLLCGTLPGIGLLFAVRPLILSSMNIVFPLIFSSLPLRYSATISVPFWLPIVTVAAFFLLAYLFSRNSLKGILGRDVIQTLGEVN